jgi:nicotinamidase/pyrazinamidase
LYVCGLATDVCVAATAENGLDLNYRIILIEDACRGVDTQAISDTKKKLIQKGAIVLNSKQVYRMVTHDDRRPELGYAALKEINRM